MAADRRIIFLLATLAICTRSTAQSYIWWEGENPTSTNFPPKSPFAASTFPDRANLLSNNNWLSTGGKRGKDVLFAKYKVNVGSGVEYSFWVRKFWSHGPFRWRFDDDDWHICNSSFGMADDTPLKKFVNANWVSLGKVNLAAGEHPLEIQLLAGEGEDTACGFDCFVLSRGVFVPSGKLKPGEKTHLADSGYFPFEPDADPFTVDSPLDLRDLNEKSAGQSGFLKRSGEHFSLGDGSPVRFWAVNVGIPNSSQDRTSVDYLARKLAKLGVNMVRFHGALYDKADPTKIDSTQLDNLFYLEAAMKRQGIYTYLSFYFPLWVDASNPKLNLPGFDKSKNKTPFALLFFDPRMQTIHRDWARQLLNMTNPYTNLTLARDPALGIVEIVNEDSMFFWTFTKKNIPDEKWTELEDQYSRWLAGKYGSVETARANWGSSPLPQDSADHAGLYEAYAMTQPGVQRFGAARIGDQVRFLAQTQRDFYASTIRFFKDDLHYGGLVNAGNWYTADQTLLAPIDRWANAAGDMIDQHGYVQPQVTGDGSAYTVRAASTFKSTATVLQPATAPLRFFKTAGLPQISSEIGWTNPNRYRADSIFLSAAYGSLQNVDGLFFFAVGNNYLHDSAISKFGVASPMMAGAFPAAALLYRRGDVTSPAAIVDARIDMDEQFKLKGTPPYADSDLAPYVGPVMRSFDQPAGPAANQPAAFIDRNSKTVTSSTGQLKWNYGLGVAQMSTPKAQGAAGFLAKAGKIELDDLTIECSNEFAAIFVISLDDRPLASSRKILIQATTQEQPYGFKTEPDGKGGERILDLGQSPFGVRSIAVTITFRKPTAFEKLTPLDENGYARNPPKAVAADSEGHQRVELAPDSLYQILSR